MDFVQLLHCNKNHTHQFIVIETVQRLISYWIINIFSAGRYLFWQIKTKNTCESCVFIYLF